MAKEQLNLVSVLNNPTALIQSMPQDTASFDFQAELTKLIADGTATPENVSALTERAQQVSEQATLLAVTTRKIMQSNEAGDQVVVEEEMGFSIGQAVAAMRVLGKAYSDTGILLRAMLPPDFSFDHAKGELVKKQQQVRRTTTSNGTTTRTRRKGIDYAEIDAYVREQEGDDYCYDGFLPLYAKLGKAERYALLDISNGKVRNGEYDDDSVVMVNGDARKEWDSVLSWARSVAEEGGRTSPVNERAEVRVVWSIDPSKPEKYPTIEKLESLID